MATILPGSPPTFDRNDVSGTVKALCSYTRSLQENLDFMLGQLQRSMTSMESSIEGLNSTLSALENQYGGLARRVTALEQKDG